MNIKNTVTELIGNTPLLRLRKMEERFGARGEIVAKVELFNPAGSIKDRVGYNMIIEAEKSGRLKPGGTIIEPTSGNTGVGLAMTAAARGYKAIMVMPESMSVERRKLLAALGAELVLTDKSLGMKGSLDKADQLAKEIPGSIIAGQFENPANPQIHYETTATGDMAGYRRETGYLRIGVRHRRYSDGSWAISQGERSVYPYRGSGAGSVAAGDGRKGRPS